MCFKKSIFQIQKLEFTWLNWTQYWHISKKASEFRVELELEMNKGKKYSYEAQ